MLYWLSSPGRIKSKFTASLGSSPLVLSSRSEGSALGSGKRKRVPEWLQRGLPRAPLSAVQVPLLTGLVEAELGERRGRGRLSPTESLRIPVPFA